MCGGPSSGDPSVLADQVNWQVESSGTQEHQSSLQEQRKGEDTETSCLPQLESERLKMKGWFFIQGQGDGFMSGEECGGGAMLFLRGTALVLTSMCVSG